MDQISQQGSDVLRDLLNSLGAVLLLVLYIVIYFAVASLLKNVVVGRLRGSRFVRKYGREGELMIYRSIAILAYVLAGIAVLSQMGVHSTGILTLLSAFTVAVGLSLQDVLKNLFSGLFMLAEKPFSVGDRVMVRDKEGTIEGIDIRTTVMKSDDGAILMVPNSVMFTEILQNNSRSAFRYLHLTIEADLTGHHLSERVHGALVPVVGVRLPIAPPQLATRSAEAATWKVTIGWDASQPGADVAIIDALITALPNASITRTATP